MRESKPKDYTSTIMRMAGNIAAGLASAEHNRNAYPARIAEESVELARLIVAEVLKADPPVSGQEE